MRSQPGEASGYLLGWVGHEKMIAATKERREVLQLNVTCQGRWRGDPWVGRKLVQVTLRSVHPLEKEIAIHSSTIAWKIPWTEEPGGLQSIGSQRVRHE